MKKALYMAAAVALLGMSACTGTSCDSKVCKTDDKVYTGVLPAADCDGIRYTLKLDYDDDHNYTDGDYDLLETYIAADSTSALGYKDLRTVKSEGDFTVVKTKDGKTGLKLVEEVRKGQQGETMYFVVDSDSTITMTNSDFETAASGLNYTLKLAK